jgi:hypothetical protein
MGKSSLTKPKGANGSEIQLEWDKFAKEAWRYIEHSLSNALDHT